MGLSAWNAYRARKAAEEQALGLISTSPAKSGVEVETKKTVEQPEIEEPKPKKKRK